MVLSIHSVKSQNLKKKMCNYAPEKKNTQIQCNIKVSEIRTLKKCTLYIYQCLKNKPRSHKISHDKTRNIFGRKGKFPNKIQAIYKNQNIIKTWASQQH